MPGLAGALLLLFLVAPLSHVHAAAKKVTADAAPEKKPKKVKASRKKPGKVAALPARPPANLPEVTEPASVWQGCLGPSGLPVLASKLAIEEERLGSLLADLDVLSHGESESQIECVPYMAATGGEGGTATATFQRTEPTGGQPPTVAIHKNADGVVATPGVCDCPEPSRRVLTVPVPDMKEPSHPVISSIPPNIRWQLDILVPRMVAKRADANAYTARIVLERELDLNGDPEADASPLPERLESIEILDSVSGTRVDGAWWVERAAGPGVLIGMDGVVYERVLWQSPVKYRYQSRGVGPRTRTIRQAVSNGKDGAGGKNSKGPVRMIRLGGYHLGVDMMAPKGADIHAIGDAVVAFAGWRGGFGKLIILDHGLGYQTYYAHLSVIPRSMKAGVTVSRGQIIGLVGSTGHSTAPHLHFEARKNGIYFDPFDDSREPEYWLLSADDQERLAMRLLMPAAEQGKASAVAQYQSGGTIVP
jgi:murein DD-endopeptidase MepM/ murein hydrolase activator NlpD